VSPRTPALPEKAQAALGFPIEVVAGREERASFTSACPRASRVEEKRLVVDIGGGSTEFIIGAGHKSLKLESLFMGCVSYSLRFFPDGKISKSAMKQAELAARTDCSPSSPCFSRGNWQQAVGSSGTVRSIADVMQLNGFDDGNITPAASTACAPTSSRRAISTGRARGVEADRVPVFPGGLAIMNASSFGAQYRLMVAAGGAMRQGRALRPARRFHHRTCAT
jgi:exopolyphosphatase/guanosine-5'-triphosphate,3'-diphosphate pyrophosphatase